MRRPDGVSCPRSSPDPVIQDGRDDTQPPRHRHEGRPCRQPFDDLTDTIVAAHRPPLRTWIARLDLMGPDHWGLQVAQGLDINDDDGRAMIGQPRPGTVDRRPPVVPEGRVG